MSYNIKIKFFETGDIQVITYKFPIVSKKKKIPGFEDYSLDWDIVRDEVDKELRKDKKIIKSEENERGSENSLKDDNIARSLRRAKTMIIDYGRSNLWEYFLTFTFSPEKVDRSDYSVLSKKIRNFFSNQRRLSGNSDGKYLLVPERHSDGVSWHFHALVSGFDLGFVPAKNPNTGSIIRDKKGRIIYNASHWRLGFSTATKIEDSRRAVSYCLKYISKSLGTDLFGKQKYFVSNNCSLPEERLFLCEPQNISDFLTQIATNNGVSIVGRRSIDIVCDNYSNIIQYFELQ